MPEAPPPIAPDVHRKAAALADWLRAQQAVVIGFSGGVDSTYLAAVAREALGRDAVIAVLGVSASVPMAQIDAARELATRLDLALVETATDELAVPEYAANPSNRCYFCKRELWSRVAPIARGYPGATVCDGTNADDLTDHRPGALAAAQRAVASPLALAGLTKAEIRALSRERGLPTWSQPAAPCLASRLVYGLPVTADRLGAVELAEAGLRALGIEGDLRVRHHGALARVELTSVELTRWLAPDRLVSLAAVVRRAGFERVTLDLAGFRSGSLNVLHGISRARHPHA